MVSTKFYSAYDELEVFASAWAEEGGVDVERLKQLEIMFLNAIQFNIMVSQNEFHEKLRTVERLLAMKEGLARGWLTYTELELMMPSIEIAKRILNYTTILMLSYACSIATIALSSIILASIPPTTDLGTTNVNLTQQTSLISLREAFQDYEFGFDERKVDLDFNYTRNFTINYPLFDRVTNWEASKDREHITNFHLVPKKFEPVPLPW